MGIPDIRLLGREAGAGLARDLALMESILQSPDVSVHRLCFHGSGLSQALWEAQLWMRRATSGKVAVQIFAERIYPRCLKLAESNLLVPNPEWTHVSWLPYLLRFDAVLCKTWHAERIFRMLGCRTRYIGFTSEDGYDPTVVRQHAFFHMAGQSSAKGTKVLLETWKRHPEWPLLTVVQNPRKAAERVLAANIDHRAEYIDDASLRRLQNAHAFHICPSETEGFGHYLMEAMSMGAITLTTAAEPMNELVTEQRGILIAPASSRRVELATYFYVAPEGIEKAVVSALGMSDAERHKMSAAARDFYLGNKEAFVTRLRDEVALYLPHKPTPVVPAAGAVNY